MNLYASSTLLWGYSFPHICDRLAESGFQGIELWVEQFWHERFTAENVIETLHQTGLELSMHSASWDLNLCSLNDGIRAQSIVEVVRSMELAHKLGASSLTIHPGRQTIRNHWQAWHIEQLHRSLDEIEKVAEQLKIIVSIELMEAIHKEFITTPDQLNRLVANRNEYIRTTFDIAHVDLDQSPVEWMKVQHRIDKVHLSDATRSTYHVPLGEGAIAMEEVLDALRSFENPIVIEGLDFRESNRILERNVNYLLKHHLLKKAEVSI